MSDDTEAAVSGRVELSRTVEASDLEPFAALSLDDNPLHFDAEFARSSFFGQLVAPGMVGLLLLSGGVTKLMGPGNIWLGGDFKFEKPILFGDQLTAALEIESMDRRGIAIIKASVANQRDEVVITANFKSMKARTGRR